MSTNNTFEELISGIALGKKWARGQGIQNDFTEMYSNTDYGYRLYLKVSGLNFTPSVILFVTPSENSNYRMSHVIYYKNSVLSTQKWLVLGAGGMEHKTTLDSEEYIKNTGFCLKVHYYGGSYRYDNVKYSWIAYE